MRAGLAAAALAAAGLMRAPGAGADVLELLYLEPNVGSSAGGHAALRVDDRVYDFQNADFETLRLRRNPYAEYTYLYSVLENRTIHVARLDAPAETRAAIDEAFNERYLVQNQHAAVLESLRRDLDWIAWLGAPADPEARSWRPLRGAGFFHDGRGRPTPRPSPALEALRDRIAKERGADFASARIAAVRREIETLAPAAAAFAPRVLPDARPVAGYLPSDRYTDLVLQWTALRVLDAGTALRPEARRAAPGGDLELSPGEREALEAFAAGLEESVVSLTASSRPDWGYAALLALARLEAVRASLESGRWVVLEAYGPEGDSITVRHHDAFLRELAANARRELAAARARLTSRPRPGERDYAWLEDAANRHLELELGLNRGGRVRLRGESRLPALEAPVAGAPRPLAGADALQRAGREAAERERAYRGAVREAFGYDLVSRNCITEILATLEAALGRERLERELGGYVDSDGALHFVPALGYRAIVGTYRTAAVGEVPSYRRVRLERMYAEENDLRVFLRESNTLSSTVYRRNRRDSFFLFFTDDAPLLRPVFGAFNLAAGLGQMSAGMLRAPFDRGAMLWAGAKGSFFSLPELFFVNFRKGMLEYAPTDPPRTRARLH